MEILKSTAENLTSVRVGLTVVTHACNLSTWKAGAGQGSGRGRGERLLEVQGQPRLYYELKLARASQQDYSKKENGAYGQFSA